MLVWLLPSTDVWVVPVDLAVFRSLNGVLTDTAWETRLWAFLNTRQFDLLAGIVMGLFFVLPGLVYRGRRSVEAVFEFAAVFFSFSLMRIVAETLSSPRLSPSRELYPNFHNLLELVPEWQCKVYSEHSFPSDHAAVVFVWAMYIVASSSRPGRWLAVPYALFISTPRLVGGAHWFTDVLLGSVPLALFGFSWGYFTPLRALGQRWGSRLASRLPFSSATEEKNSG